MKSGFFLGCIRSLAFAGRRSFVWFPPVKLRSGDHNAADFNFKCQLIHCQYNLLKSKYCAGIKKDHLLTYLHFVNLKRILYLPSLIID